MRLTITSFQYTQRQARIAAADVQRVSSVPSYNRLGHQYGVPGRLTPRRGIALQVFAFRQLEGRGVIPVKDAISLVVLDIGTSRGGGGCSRRWTNDEAVSGGACRGHL